MDVYPLRMPVKGGFVFLNFERVYVTTNLYPYEIHSKVENVNLRSALARRFEEQTPVRDAEIWNYWKPSQWSGGSAPPSSLQPED